MVPPAGASTPPATRREVVTETLHGTEIVDPFRWLENDNTRVQEWLDAQNEYTDAHLDSAVQEHLRPKMKRLADVPNYSPIKVENGKFFQTVRGAADDHSRLLVRRSPDEEGTVLADPNEWSTNDDANAPACSIRWFLPAYDGEHIAYGVTEGGEDQIDIHVVSVPDGDEIAVMENCGRVFLGIISFDAVSPGMVAWDADSDGFYYVATGDTESGAQITTELRHWRFDSGEQTLFEHDNQHAWPTVKTDPESGTLAVGFHDVSGTDWHVSIDEELRPVIVDSDAETFVTFHDDTVFFLTDYGASRKRLLSCSLSRFRDGDLTFEECETVLPEHKALLHSFAVTSRHIVAQYLTDAHARLAVYSHDGEHLHDLSLADYVSVSQLRVCDDTEDVFYQVESFHLPPTLVRANPATGNHRELTTVDVELPEMVVRQEFVESTNGAKVPVFVCHRADVKLDGDNPAVLSGYGGFRSNRPPRFDRFRVAFLTDGGVYAQVCARGGQEYGESWHEDGMLANKQHTFDDFIAAGEFLCSAEYTSSDRLAVVGRSNGGLSVGAVVTQRPDLWTAARCSVPLLDMLRFHRFLIGESWTTEYGHPEDADAFEYLRAYSPYHNIERGIDYPAILLTTAAEDARVHPAHARKMAARLQNEADGGPFLLRTKIDTGHGGGKPSSMLVAEQTDEWAFLYDRLGIDN
ncbi:prolyl oligopeptidase family serine peptidase [Haladaptatus caseinilyticus]|uniref:prolyl oligopeptidase family serine peptidase n=1 Tax=Haladaptatus caseinilyticus TaxID=2993314 RepID=UPI00224A78CD|nr:prolyl oligopeptidase family serine peptidase [Haladaptatus caseinilyticus]